MKHTALLLFTIAFLSANCQIINQNFNRTSEFGSNKKNSIQLSGNDLYIKTKVVFNALPDGYHVTYTFTTIDQHLEKIELSMIEKTKRLQQALKK